MSAEYEELYLNDTANYYDLFSDLDIKDLESDDYDEPDDINDNVTCDYSDLIENYTDTPVLVPDLDASYPTLDFNVQLDALRQELADLDVVAEPEFDGNCECPFCYTHSPESAKERGYGAYGKIERWGNDNKHEKVYYALRLLLAGYSVNESAKLMVTYFNESNVVRMASRISNISRGNSHRAITGIRRKRNLSDQEQLAAAIDFVSTSLPRQDNADHYEQIFQGFAKN